MEIKTALNAGFCFGVKNAVKEAEQATSQIQNQPVYCLGEIVHNSHVVNKLKKAGMKIVKSLEEITSDNGIIILSAHGVSPEIIEKAKQKNIEVINTTCPMVTKVQQLAASLNNQGKNVILTGDKSHPEVKGVVKWGNDRVIVISSLNEAKKLSYPLPVDIISQTTFSTDLFEQIVNHIKNTTTQKVVVHNTICKATEKRQKETEELAKSTDTMFIIGGKNSANTKRLYEISLKYSKNAFWITDDSEVSKEMLTNSKIIGVTAGASTPADIIKAVENKIQDFANE